jgi:hypothetical protein
MNDMNLTVTDEGRKIGFYAQGEYKADLTKAAVEVKPAFARHLIAMGYAESNESPAESKESLMKLSKADLLKQVKTRGLSVETDANKAAIIEVLLSGKSADLPVFIERKASTVPVAASPSVGEVASVPTDELVLKDGTGVLAKGDK